MIEAKFQKSARRRHRLGIEDISRRSNSKPRNRSRSSSRRRRNGRSKGSKIIVHEVGTLHAPRPSIERTLLRYTNMRLIRRSAIVLPPLIKISERAE